MRLRRCCARALLILAGVLAALAAASSATAGTRTYCNNCTLGSTPAVSVEEHFTSNHSSTFVSKKQQIYYYIFGTTECAVGSQVRVFGLNSICTTGFATTTARCHLLDDGTSLATCWADYPSSLAGASNGLDVVDSVLAPSGTPVDSETAAWLAAEDQTGAMPQVGSHIFAASRRLGALPNGSAVYVVPTTRNRVCVVLEMSAESCGNPLSRTSPVTFTTVDSDGPGGTAPVAYGYTLDGVKSVSFAVAGAPRAIAVSNNLFVDAEAASVTIDDFSSPSVTFADGSTQLAR